MLLPNPTAGIKKKKKRLTSVQLKMTRFYYKYSLQNAHFIETLTVDMRLFIFNMSDQNKYMRVGGR